MRKLTPLLLAAAVGVGSTLGLVAPAQAATVVSVKKIANPAPGEIGTTVTIKPSVSVSKNVRVSSSLLNVSLDGKAVVRNQKSATLKRTALSVTYNVSTVVKYRVRDSKGKLGPTRQKSLRQTLTVKPVYTTKCATPAGFESVVLGDTPSKGDTIGTVAKKLGEPLDGESITLKQLRSDAVKENNQETVAAIDSLYERGYTPATVLSAYAFEGWCCQPRCSYSRRAAASWSRTTSLSASPRSSAHASTASRSTDPTPAPRASGFTNSRDRTGPSGPARTHTCPSTRPSTSATQARSTSPARNAQPTSDPRTG